MILTKKHPSRVSLQLRKCCERLSIDSNSFPPTIRDIEEFEKNNRDVFITIFEYDGFHKIKEADNNLRCYSFTICIKIKI